MANFKSQIFKPLTSGLTDRQQEVLERRFGIDRAPETLEAIGQDPNFGVTRERVRQIEAAALNVLQENIGENEDAQNFLNQAKVYLASQGGVARKDRLQVELANVTSGVAISHLDLLAKASGAFKGEDETDTEHAFYYVDSAAKKQFRTFLARWKKTLEKSKEEVLEGPQKYHAQLASFRKGEGVPDQHIQSCLDISKEIQENPYGDIGLASWEEISPRTVRDRIYLALKKHGEPAHFTEVAELINNANFDEKEALASTCHNELIKDKRFVLVGRGMYALREDGHREGTAKEVIHRILREQGPLSAHEVQLAVQKERLYRKNTIVVNLQNKGLFRRREDGKYEVQEA